MTTVNVPCGFGLEDAKRRKPHAVLDQREVNLGRGIVATRRRNEQEVLQLRSDSQATASLLLTLGARFNDDDVPDGEVDRRAPVIAELDWGQGGAEFSAQVDWRTGTQLLIPASFVNVSARFEDLAADPDPIFLRLRVDAGLAPGSNSHRAYPTRTFPRTTIPAGGAAVFPVPPFAYSVIPYADFSPPILSPGATRVEIRGGPAATDRLYATFTGDLWNAIAISGEGYRLPGAGRFVRIVNGNAPPAATLPVTVMFGLGL